LSQIAPPLDANSAAIGGGAVLSIRDLHLTFASRDARGALRHARVLNGVDLDVGPGRIVGLIGETGAGKSMTATATIGLLPASAEVKGKIVFEATDLLTLRGAALDKVRGARIGFVAQNPRAALEPVTRVGDQLVRLIQAHSSLSTTAARQRAIEILAAVGIPDPQARYRAYPHELSGGMAQRVVIAMALVNQPQLVIADEPTTGLDVTVQAQVLDLLQKMVRAQGAASLIITHDLGIVAQYCDDMAIMFAGRVVERGPVAQVFADPRHPYTRRLIAASRARIGNTLTSLKSDPPDLFRQTTACVYADRCELVAAVCQSAPIEKTCSTAAPDHRVLCHLAQSP
jgi:peptide/nickel transport system ATP-binding protein/oligopeptide transport system ATP-binding protein